MAEETDEINKRIRNCVVNIISLYTNEENEYESLRLNIQNFVTIYEKKYKEFVQEMNTLEINCNDAKLPNDNMHKTLAEKNNVLKTNQKKFNDLESKHNLLLKELEGLQKECIKTKKKSELSSVDKTILDLSRKKLELYGQLTNIMWDYASLSSSTNVIGYVRNKENNYLHAFEFKKNGISSTKLIEKLWKEIEQGSEEVWSDIIAMTDLKIISKENN